MRTKVVNVRMTDEEYGALVTLARGDKVASYVRFKLFGKRPVNGRPVKQIVSMADTVLDYTDSQIGEYE